MIKHEKNKKNLKRSGSHREFQEKNYLINVVNNLFNVTYNYVLYIWICKSTYTAKFKHFSVKEIPD